MLGAELKSLMRALEIKGTVLARELGVDVSTVRDYQRSKLSPATETKITTALGTIARRLAAERQRAKTAELLRIVDKTLLDLSSTISA